MRDTRSEITDTPTIQFHLLSIFIVTMLASIVSGYLSSHSEHLVPVGIITISVTGSIAALIGVLWPPLMNRLFWAMVVTAMVQTVTAGVILLSEYSFYGWPITAGLGAIAAAESTSLYPRMLKSSLVVATSMTCFVLIIEAPLAAKIANVVTASIGGALLGAMIESFVWVERKQWATQPIIGFSLITATIVFSAMAPHLIPGW